MTYNPPTEPTGTNTNVSAAASLKRYVNPVNVETQVYKPIPANKFTNQPTALNTFDEFVNHVMPKLGTTSTTTTNTTPVTGRTNVHTISGYYLFEMPAFANMAKDTVTDGGEYWRGVSNDGAHYGGNLNLKIPAGADGSVGQRYRPSVRAGMSPVMLKKSNDYTGGFGGDFALWPYSITVSSNGGELKVNGYGTGITIPIAQLIADNWYLLCRIGGSLGAYRTPNADGSGLVLLHDFGPFSGDLFSQVDQHAVDEQRIHNPQYKGLVAV